MTAVILGGGDTLTTAELRYGYLSTQTFENIADLLIRGKLPEGSSPDLLDDVLAHLLLLARTSIAEPPPLVKCGLTQTNLISHSC